jgi:hypothetical protein
MTTARSTIRKGEPLVVRLRVSEVDSLYMSVDEWVLSGLENAEAAKGCVEAGAADSFLQKAVHRFEQARHDFLVAMARTHRHAVQFRAKVGFPDAGCHNEEPSSPDGDGSLAELESSATQILGQIRGGALARSVQCLQSGGAPPPPVHARSAQRYCSSQDPEGVENKKFVRPKMR